eukprot:CAMPEP_0182574456 /NCGR_PEP_ID=MMETSP1324-20130603/25327_1 /TAXON_ID=236786 /ORGANISM="Florenciella sp., Strain RCC1587" /LENGTH=57 /DNA_ID=CAMNT_0024789831 /DNA_START=81 /DNA_END=251 /DNA_ORIENTATION=+
MTKAATTATRQRPRVVMGMHVFVTGKHVTHAEPGESKGSWGAWDVEMPQRAVGAGWA